MEERRLMLALALSFALLLGYRLLYPPEPPAPDPGPSPRASAVSPTPAPATAASAPAPELPRMADERERRIEVLGSEIEVAFTNRGARLVSWRLPRFLDGRGSAEEMVQTAPGGPRPLDIESGDPELDARLREALFQASPETVTLSGAGEQELRFEFAEGDLAAEKVLRFHPSGYLVEIEASIRRGGVELPKRLFWGPGVGNPSASERAVQGYLPPQAVCLSPAGVERIAAAQLPAPRAVEGARWLGVESRYFVALLIPRTGPAAGELRSAPLAPGDDGTPAAGPLAALHLPPGRSAALLYVGPKDHHGLSRLGHDLARVVPVGDWIGPIVVPLMGLLRWVHGYVGNYGWAIVILTVFINAAMAPLRHYSIANGVKMAKLSPEMKAIQDRYRKIPALDPRRQEMQKEIGDLYARHGMSMGTQMLVGCLPLLLTMPFLVAIYRVLEISIELRGAPFLWIPDLSQKDPLFITPVLMGLSMVLMQKMMPSVMDPTQQRMMMIMPLVLVVMFFAAPGGLNLYWLASNVCSILQQGITLRIIHGTEAAPAPRKEKPRRRH